MSTQPQTPADLTTRTVTERFTARDAPQTFDPFNTRRCPEMFQDKWKQTNDGPATR